MGRNVKKTVYFDFFGLPGSGKSTNAHNMAKKLREQGYMVKEPSFEDDHKKNVIYRKIKKLLTTILFSAVNRCKYRSVRALVSRNGYSLHRNGLNQIINIITKLSAIKQYSNRVEYVIFDEGLAQAAISLSVNSDIPANENLSQIMSMLDGEYRIIFINTEIDLEIALERIAYRNSRDTRIEKMESEEQKKNMMRRYESARMEIENMKYNSDIEVISGGIPI